VSAIQGLLVVGLLLVGACTDDGPPRDPAAQSSSEETVAPRPYRRVPDVTGLQSDLAKASAEAKGFRVTVIATEYSACVREGKVLGQAPPAGFHRPQGSVVRLQVNGHSPESCGLELPPPSPALARLGRQFVGFARGRPGVRVPVASSVALYLGGHLVHTIPAARAVHPWSYGWLCSFPGGYAGRTCPFSSTKSLAEYPGDVAVTAAPPQHTCMHSPTLADAGRPRLVTLTPDEPRSCTDYFAVELELDASGRLITVNLVWSEP
jgi:hypothetical protein